MTDAERERIRLRALLSLGLRDGEETTAAERRITDLGWAVFGPLVAAAFIWTVFGEAIGALGVLVMVPFVVVGVREVLSGRVEARRSSSR